MGDDLAATIDCVLRCRHHSWVAKEHYSLITGEVMAIWDDVIPEEERQLFLNQGWQRGDLPYGTRPVVLVVDMTYAFVTDEYPTGWGATGIPCASAIKDLLKAVRAKGVPVIYSRGGKGSTPAERGFWKDGGAGLRNLGDTRRHQIYHELEPQQGEIVLEKSKPSAFFGTDMASILNYYHADTLIVTGMVDQWVREGHGVGRLQP